MALVTKITEGKRPGEHLLSEEGMISRDEVTIAAGQNLEAGTVLELSGAKYVRVATPGSAVAVLFSRTDATEGDVKAAAHTRLCEVVSSLLVWPTGFTTGNKTTAIAALKAQTIIVRTPVA